MPSDIEVTGNEEPSPSPEGIDLTKDPPVAILWSLPKVAAEKRLMITHESSNFHKS